MQRAAGILFCTTDSKLVLFLQRSAKGDRAGQWCFPGGGIEEGETAEQAAERECIEETGWLPDGPRAEWTRRQKDGVDFTTFLQRVSTPFVPTLNEEHTSYAWAPIDKPPQPLHPGCQVSLDRFDLDEVGIARAIMVGDLVSPTKYENVWLFDIRITGTGTAFRRKLDEFVYRRPENYLSDDFLTRCNGLPVIVYHPPTNTLDSKEFGARVVGTILMPYLGDGQRHPKNEVWGVAKIYDDAAAKWMSEHQISTSPAVVFRDPSVNSKLKLEDGSTLLIEGKPSLLDHLALCEQGVWDKGNPPDGVESVNAGIKVLEPAAIGDSQMPTEEELKAAEAKAEAEKSKEEAKGDAEAGQKLDKVLEALDSLSGRMDAYEEEEHKRHEGEDEAEGEQGEEKHDESEEEDEKEHEAEEEREAEGDAEKEEGEGHVPDQLMEHLEEKEKERKADSDDIRAKIAEMEKKLPKQVSDADYAAMADIQARADEVFQAFGDHAPRPLDAENQILYRRRLARQLQKHSPDWSKVDLVAIADTAAFDIAEKRIYADAMNAAMHPTDLPQGVLRTVVRQRHPHLIHEFVGQPSAWMDDIAHPGGVRQGVSEIIRPNMGNRN